MRVLWNDKGCPKAALVGLLRRLRGRESVAPQRGFLAKLSFLSGGVAEDVHGNSSRFSVSCFGSFAQLVEPLLVAGQFDCQASASILVSDSNSSW